MQRKYWYFLLAAIVVFGILLRIALWGTATESSDGVNFMRLGVNLIEHGTFRFGEDFNRGITVGPGYPIAIGLLQLIVRNMLIVARLVSFIACIATMFLLYALGKKFSGRMAGIVAAFFYAAYPIITIRSTTAQATPLYIASALLCIYLFEVYKNKPAVYPIFGILAAITYFIRPEGVFLLVIPFVWILVEKRFSSLKWYVACVVVFLLVISPYILFIHDNTGQWTITGRTISTAAVGKLIYMPAEERTLLARQLDTEKLGLKIYVGTLEVPNVRETTAWYRYVRGMYAMGYLFAIQLAPIFLLLIAFVASVWIVGDSRRYLPILASLCLVLMAYIYITVASQYMFLTDTLCMLFAAIGFSRLNIIAKYFLPKIQNKHITGLGAILLAVFIVLSSVMFYLDNTPVTTFGASERAGEYLKHLSPEYESINVMADQPWVSLYSGAKATSLPCGDVNATLRYAKKYHVDYIVVQKKDLTGGPKCTNLFYVTPPNISVVYEEPGVVRVLKLDYV